MIASERKKSIRKDPGRWDERLEPKRERDEWICAPVTRSRGRRNTTTGKKQKLRKRVDLGTPGTRKTKGVKKEKGKLGGKGNRCVCGGLHQWNWNLIHKGRT
jgi:hypothetical protein